MKRTAIVFYDAALRRMSMPDKVLPQQTWRKKKLMITGGYKINLVPDFAMALKFALRRMVRFQ